MKSPLKANVSRPEVPPLPLGGSGGLLKGMNPPSGTAFEPVAKRSLRCSETAAVFRLVSVAPLLAVNWKRASSIGLWSPGLRSSRNLTLSPRALPRLARKKFVSQKLSRHETAVIVAPGVSSARPPTLALGNPSSPFGRLKVVLPASGALRTVNLSGELSRNWSPLGRALVLVNPCVTSGAVNVRQSSAAGEAGDSAAEAEVRQIRAGIAITKQMSKVISVFFIGFLLEYGDQGQ